MAVNGYVLRFSVRQEASSCEMWHHLLVDQSWNTLAFVWWTVFLSASWAVMKRIWSFVVFTRKVSSGKYAFLHRSIYSVNSTTTVQ